MTALDSTHTTAVDHAYHWQPMATCPKGSKVQLLTRYGCAIYGTWTGKDTIYERWAPPLLMGLFAFRQSFGIKAVPVHAQALVTPKPQERANIGLRCLTFGISSS